LKIKDYILSFFIILIFVISTSGINYVKHFCNVCGFNDIHLFVAYEHEHGCVETDCCSNNQNEILNNCCSNVSTNENLSDNTCNIDSKCCNFKNEFLKISDDFLNQNKPLLNISLCFLNIDNFTINEVKVTDFPNFYKENYTNHLQIR
jgi:hypothetical protein